MRTFFETPTNLVSTLFWASTGIVSAGSDNCN